MNLYLSQDSYYFVHKNFLTFFEESNSEIIFVKEKKRGIFKKYIEIFLEFGLWNSIYILIQEYKYFIKLKKRRNKLKVKFVNDFDLNKVLEDELKFKKFDRVFSIGCPCLIDNSLQQKFLY